MKAEWTRPSRGHIRASTLNTGNLNPTMKEKQANQSIQGNQANQAKQQAKQSTAKRIKQATLNEQATQIKLTKRNKDAK